MTALTGKTPANTYKDLLQISNSNAGIDATLRAISDGEGTACLLELSTADIAFNTDTLFVDTGTGRVGINEAAPATTLNVSGDVRISGGNQLSFDGTEGGGGSEGILVKDSGGSFRNALNFPGSNETALANRGPNGFVSIRANGASGGGGSEVTCAIIQDTEFAVQAVDFIVDTDTFKVDATTKSIVVGSAAIATTATDGFLYIPTCAGTPTGVPTALTGRAPMVYDSTGNKFWMYDGGWIGIALA